MKISFSDNSNLTLKILRDGRILGLEVSSNDYKEKIDISPYGSIGYIVHDITKGEYNYERHGYPYRFYSGIFKAGTTKELNKKLHVYLEESEYECSIDHIGTYVDKTSDNEDDVIQKGLLMQELDEDMYEKIKKLQEMLRIGNTSLFDNIVSICFDSYSDEEIESLLGIKRKTFLYQDGSNDLTSSYYVIDKNNPFNLPSKQNSYQKKLTPPKNTESK